MLTPKDGLSAGIGMALALDSLATQPLIKGNRTMTGELILMGKVLPLVYAKKPSPLGTWAFTN